MPLKSILIGSNGYLGRHLALELATKGFENFNYDLCSESPVGINNYRPFDITNKDDFKQLDPNVDFIFLFAGLTGTAEGFTKYREFIEVNEIGLLNLLEWMRETGCRARVVFPSTRLVYKGVTGCLLKEDDPKEAKTVYAANKLSAEEMLRMHNNAFDIDYTVFRICVPYGNAFGGGYSYGTLGFFLGQAEAGQDLSLFGTGQVRRTFTHVSDISALIIKAIQLEKTKNEVYNIGGENFSLLEVAERIAIKYGIGVHFVEWPEMALRLESDSTVFDDSKLRAIGPFEFKKTLGRWLMSF